jgi:hypothetical protein
MKRIFFFAIILFSLNSMAQTSVMGMGGFGLFTPADTVTAGSSDTLSVWVKNYGPAIFNNYLTLNTAVRDSLAPASLDTVNIYTSPLPVTIDPGDSLEVTLTAIYNISPSGYRYGIDVIVIWPYSNSSITIDSLEFSVYIEGYAGINEQQPDPMIRIYPNPSSNIIIVDHPSGSSVEEITIYDLTGKVIMISHKESSVNIENLAPGMYYADILLNGNKRFRAKIVTQK